MKERRPYTYRLGYFVAIVLVTCLAVCISAVVLALTARFLMWLFPWIF